MALDSITIATQGLLSGSSLLLAEQGIGDVIVVTLTNTNFGGPPLFVGGRRVLHRDIDDAEFYNKVARMRREDIEIERIVLEIVKCLN